MIREQNRREKKIREQNTTVTSYSKKKGIFGQYQTNGTYRDVGI
jgi:hypothetical protein